MKQIATDLISDQTESGAIREEMGDIRLGYMRPPRSNDSYGTGEAPLIHENGDPVADLLYTCNFALLGLHEASAATGDPLYQSAKEKLIEFLLRVQVKSELQPELDGAWFRAFDFRRWDYFASNADAGWGAWAIECGWTQGWITTGLALHLLQLNLWDMSKDSGIAEHMAKLRPLMLPDDQLTVAPLGRKRKHAAVGKQVISLSAPDPRYPGQGAAQLTDGVADPCAGHAAWLGYEGIDCEMVVDMGEVTTVRTLEVSCLQQTQLGIYLPVRIQFAVSQDGQSFVSLPAVDNPASTAEPGPFTRLLGLTNQNVEARFVKATLDNVGVIPAGQPGGGLNGWLFTDELLINRCAD